MLILFRKYGFTDAEISSWTYQQLCMYTERLSDVMAWEVKNGRSS